MLRRSCSTCRIAACAFLAFAGETVAASHDASAQVPEFSQPVAPSRLDVEQERRLGELELRVRQAEERQRRSDWERDSWLGWTRNVKISGYLQPQGLIQWGNAAASPNLVDGALPPGVSSSAVIAKPDSVFGGQGTPGLTSNGDYFRLRRARLKIELDPNEYSAFIFEVDPTLAGGPDNATGTIARNVESDGIARWAPGVETVFGAGIFKVPFGWEVLQSDADRPFVERSWWEQNVIPGEFDTGAKAYTSALGHRLTAQVAVINGITQGEKTFSLLPDLNRGKDLVGRLNYDFGAFDVGTSGYYGQGQEVSVALLAFKEYPRWAWNLEGGLHSRLLAIGDTRAFGELDLGQNMDRGVRYGALALPGLPSQASGFANGSITSRSELGGFIRIEQDLTRWSTLAARYDYYSPDTSLSDDGRHTFAVAGVAHFTKALQLMVEYDHYVDHVHAAPAAGAAASVPDKQGDLVSTVFQVRYP